MLFFELQLKFLSFTGNQNLSSIALYARSCNKVIVDQLRANVELLFSLNLVFSQTDVFIAEHSIKVIQELINR